MREDQIVRYGRQILLRELGGRGQERLLRAPVRVLGSGPAIDDAVAYLLAGGTPVVLAGPGNPEVSPRLNPSASLPAGLAPGGFLWGAQPESLNPDAAPTGPTVLDVLASGLVSTAPMQVVVGAGVAFRSAAACDDCWALTVAALAQEPGPEPVGSLAALIAQRLILGWSEPLGLILWNGESLESAPTRTCPTHSNNQ